jgi:pseudouridine kinase
MASTSEAAVLCIGGAVIDRILETIEAPLVGTSNPVRSRIAHGGVARNVAETLTRLGCRASLASLIGDDPGGETLRKHAEAAGIDMQYLCIVPGTRTAEYTAAFHKGELFAAFADMAIFDTWQAASIATLTPALHAASWVVADCNLPPAVLAELRSKRTSLPFRLAVNTVSVAKSARLGDDLSHIDVLFLNRHEAQAMTGSIEPRSAMRKLERRGAGSVVLTEGASGLHAIDSDGRLLAVSAAAVQIVNVSGAGDALIAGTVLRLAEKAPFEAAIEFGAACAMSALSSPGPVGHLARHRIERLFLPRCKAQRSGGPNE